MARLLPGCCGKLPLHSDYFTHRRDAALARFDRWLESSLRALSEQDPAWREALRAAPPSAFFCPQPEALLFGVVRPSRDKAGRDYPFALAWSLPRETWGELAPAALVALWGALELGQSWAESGWEGLKRGEARARLDTLAAEADPQRALEAWEEGLLTLDLNVRLPTPTGLEALRAELDPPPQALALTAPLGPQSLPLWLELFARAGHPPTLFTWALAEDPAPRACFAPLALPAFRACLLRASPPERCLPLPG